MLNTLNILYTRAQVAEALGIHINTLDRLVQRGELKATHIGRAVRFRPADVNEYLDSVTGAAE